MGIPRETMTTVLAAAVPTLAAIIFAGLFVRSCDRAHVAEAEVERQREAADLLKQKFTVAIQDVEALAGKAAAALAGEAKLRAEVERLEKALKAKIKVVSIREGATALVAAAGAPVAAVAGCPDCLLPAAGSVLQARVLSMDAKTEKGNLVALTHVAVDRLAPLPQTRLLDEMLAPERSSFTMEPALPLPARFSLGAGPWYRAGGPWTAEVRGGARISGPAWIDLAARFDNEYHAGVRWEIH